MTNYKDYYYKYKALKYYLKNNSIEKQIKGGINEDMDNLSQELEVLDIDEDKDIKIEKILSSYGKMNLDDVVDLSDEDFDKNLIHDIIHNEAIITKNLFKQADSNIENPIKKAVSINFIMKLFNSERIFISKHFFLDQDSQKYITLPYAFTSYQSTPLFPIDNVLKVLGIFYLVLRKDNRGAFLEYTSDDFKKDKDVVREAIKHNYTNLRHANDKFKNNKDFVLEVAMNHQIDALRYASDELRKDKDFFLELINKYDYNVEILKYAHNELRNDKDFVFELINMDHNAFRYAHNELRNDKEVFLAALIKEWHTEKKIDSEIFKKYTHINQDEIIEYIIQTTNNRQEMLEYIQDMQKIS